MTFTHQSFSPNSILILPAQSNPTAGVNTKGWTKVRCEVRYRPLNLSGQGTGVTLNSGLVRQSGNMVWGIKDEYFEKVYGKSHKPKSGTSKRRIRPSEVVTVGHRKFRLTFYKRDRVKIRSATEIPQELQSELPFEEQI